MMHRFHNFEGNSQQGNWSAALSVILGLVWFCLMELKLSMKKKKKNLTKWLRHRFTKQKLRFKAMTGVLSLFFSLLYFSISPLYSFISSSPPPPPSFIFFLLSFHFFFPFLLPLPFISFFSPFIFPFCFPLPIFFPYFISFSLPSFTFLPFLITFILSYFSS